MKKATRTILIPNWRVDNIHEATEIASMSDVLPGDITYWIARLSDWNQSIKRSYEKTLRKTTKENQFTAEQWSKLSADDQVKKSNEHQERLSDLKEQENELSFPGFVFSDFIAQRDTTSYLRDPQGNIVQRVYKKGDPLLPQRFFNLMGDLILSDAEEQTEGNSPS